MDLIALAAASILPFDPLVMFDVSNFGGNSDLIVFVERGRKLGRTDFDKTLRALDSSEGAFKRERVLTVSNCRGCEVYDELIDRWRLAEEELPVALLFPDHDEFSEKGKFRLNLAGEKSNQLKDLAGFVRNFDAGQLRPWVRGSTPVPGLPTEPEDAGPVREVTGPTFLQKVVDVDAYVLLLLYAPFCGFSKVLQPIFREFGHKFADTPHFHVASFDTTDNELPPKKWVGELEHHRVPRIYLYPRGKKTEPEVYPPEAERTSAAIMTWLEERVVPEALAMPSPAILDVPRNDESAEF